MMSLEDFEKGVRTAEEFDSTPTWKLLLIWVTFGFIGTLLSFATIFVFVALERTVVAGLVFPFLLTISALTFYCCAYVEHEWQVIRKMRGEC